MKTIKDLTTALAVAKITYRTDFPMLKGKYEAEQKRIADTYKEGAPDKKKALEKAEDVYKASVIALKNECRAMYEPIIEELETKARANASSINRDLVETVSLFLDIPLSHEEFACILEKYGNKNYYSNRILQEIANRNGITSYGVLKNGEPIALEPNLSTKLHILDELKGQAEHLIETFGTIDEDMMSRTGDLMPDILERAELLYTNGLSEKSATPQQIAIRVVDNVRTKGGRAADYLDLTLANSSEVAKNAIMNELLKSNEGSVKVAIAQSKYKTEIEAFSNGKMTTYRAAEKAINEVYDSLGDIDKANALIEANKTNSYFVELYNADTSLSTFRLNTYRYEGVDSVDMQE